MPTSVAARVAWFGKLPALGDFVGRRMPHALGEEWDHWLRSGMEQLRNEAGDHWPQRFVHTPPWFFVAPARVTGVPVCGVLAPSIDRVGRYYPIAILAVASEAAATFASDAALSQFFGAARAAIVDARRLPLNAEDLDLRLSGLVWPFAESHTTRQDALIGELLADLHAVGDWQGQPMTLPSIAWRDVASASSESSVWWVSPTPSSPYEEVVHHGAFHRSLFTRLFHGMAR
jgi:type VI secretion system protein ImpM